MWPKLALAKWPAVKIENWLGPRILGPLTVATMASGRGTIWTGSAHGLTVWRATVRASTVYEKIEPCW